MGSEIEEKNALNNLEDAAEAAAVPEEIEHRAKREKDAGAAAAPRSWFIRKKTRLAVAGFVSSSEGRRDRKQAATHQPKSPICKTPFILERSTRSLILAIREKAQKPKRARASGPGILATCISDERAQANFSLQPKPHRYYEGELEN